MLHRLFIFVTIICIEKEGYVMQKLEKMFCPSCGAPISFEEGRDDTFCSHCGHQIFREDSQLEEKNRHEEKKLYYKDRESKRDSDDIRNIFIFFGFLMIIMLIWIAMIR